MSELETVRVARKGGRGSHLINKAKYDANPKGYELVDDLDHDADGRRGGSRGKIEGDLDTYTVADLKAYAEEKGIDLGDATLKADIRAAIDASAE